MIEDDQPNALINMTISVGKTPIIINKRTLLFCVLFLAGKSLIKDNAGNWKNSKLKALFAYIKIEPPHQKTNNLHMRKQHS